MTKRTFSHEAHNLILPPLKLHKHSLQSINCCEMSLFNYCRVRYTCTARFLIQFLSLPTFVHWALHGTDIISNGSLIKNISTLCGVYVIVIIL